MIGADVDSTPRVKAPEHAHSLQEFLLYQRHFFAYETALIRANSCETFLDTACGLGPAMDLLAERCGKVIAVDLSLAALNAIPEHPNLVRKHEDAGNLSLKDNSVSVAVAFQLIEHVDTDTAQRIILEMRRVLVPGGVGFVTTPNARWRLLPGQRPWNEHHVREYWPEDVKSFCDEVDIGEDALFGVVGLDGAQEIERARVKQDPLRVNGGKLGRAVARALNKLGRGKSNRIRSARQVADDDRNKQWFTLTEKYEDGLDFWIEVRK